MGSSRGARPARQHCCQGRRAEGASEPHQRPPLRMQVSGRSCTGRRGSPALPRQAQLAPQLPSWPWAQRWGDTRGLTRFLGSKPPRTRRTKEHPNKWGGHEVTGKHTCSLSSQTSNAGADGNKLLPPPPTHTHQCGFLSAPQIILVPHPKVDFVSPDPNL